MASITQNQLKTFDTKKQATNSKSKLAAKKVTYDRAMFARLLVVSRTREVDLKDVLQYPLSSLPPSLALVDGSIANTTKPKLLCAIEADVENNCM